MVRRRHHLGRRALLFSAELWRKTKAAKYDHAVSPPSLSIASEQLHAPVPACSGFVGREEHE